MHAARGGQGRGRCAGRIGLGVVLVAAAACTPWGHPSAAAERMHEAEAEAACAPVPAPPPLPVITTLRTRDHEVTVHASDDGLRFTVALADGALLGRQLSAHEFEQSFPALQRRFDATFAGEGRWLDASIEGLRTPPASARGSAARHGLPTRAAPQRGAEPPVGVQGPYTP